MAETTEGGERMAPSELYDDQHCVMAVRADRTSRGQARRFFTSEHGIDFTEGRVLKTAYRFDADWEQEQREDGIKEPYDGWPMWECRSTDEGAVEFWKFDPSPDRPGAPS